MPIRSGVYRIGEVVLVQGTFLTAAGTPNPEATDARLTVRRPDGTLVAYGPLTPSLAGIVAVNLAADAEGRFHCRLECAGEYPAVDERHFDVAASTVLSPPAP